MNVIKSDITEYSVTLSCELPCFTPDLQCELNDLTKNGMSVNVPVNITNIADSFMSYDYPRQNISVIDLDKNTTYSYCVTAVNMNTNESIGNPFCSSFTTKDGCKYICTFICM